jgi:hypothetical protein
MFSHLKAIDIRDSGHLMSIDGVIPLEESHFFYISELVCVPNENLESSSRWKVKRLELHTVDLLRRKSISPQVEQLRPPTLKSVLISSCV